MKFATVCFMLVLFLFVLPKDTVANDIKSNTFLPFLSNGQNNQTPSDINAARTDDDDLMVLVQFTPGTDAYSMALTYRVAYIDKLPSLPIHRLVGTHHRLHNRLAHDSRVVFVEDEIAKIKLEVQQRYFDTSGHDFEALKRYFGASSGDMDGSDIFENSSGYQDGDDDDDDNETVLVVTDNQAFDKVWEEWPMHATNAYLAHAMGTGTDVTVAVLDSGVDQTHPMLENHLLPLVELVPADGHSGDAPNGIDEDEDGDVDEATGHGTHIAGIIAAVAPHAKILPIRVLNSDGGGNLSDIAHGITYAVDNGADVINMSFSSQLDSSTLQAAIQYALDRNVILVAAASGTAAGLDYPAGYDGVISVGATQKDDHVSEFSLPFASLVDVFAPGEMIYSTYINDDFAWWSGTSMAAPFVAAQAAILIEYGGCVPACVTDSIVNDVRPVIPHMGSLGLIDVNSSVHNVELIAADETGNTVSTPLPTVTSTPAQDLPPTAIKVYVDQDNWLKEQAPGDNFGDNDELLVQKKLGDSTRSVYRFDLASVPQNATVQSAYANFWITQSSRTEVAVHRINNDWTEFSATWRNLADAHDSNSAGTFTPSSSSRFVTVDITTLVQAWVDSSASNYGIMLIGSSEGSESKFSSSEWSSSSKRPYLEVIYGLADASVDTGPDNPNNEAISSVEIAVQSTLNAQAADVFPGPSISVCNSRNSDDDDDGGGSCGYDVFWRHTVLNSGTVELTNISVSDSNNSPVFCETNQLAPGEQMLCQARTVAQYGSRSTTVTACGNGDGSWACSSDTTYYYGVSPSSDDDDDDDDDDD